MIVTTLHLPYAIKTCQQETCQKNKILLLKKKKKKTDHATKQPYRLKCKKALNYVVQFQWRKILSITIVTGWSSANTETN